jgi:hypothetical protein
MAVAKRRQLGGRRRIYSKDAKVAKGRGGEERDWVLEISDWDERRNGRNFKF